MVKSLGDYNKEKSSLVNLKNIKWSQKNPVDATIQKKKKKKKISPLNIIPKKKTTETKTKQKIYKIEENSNEEKSKKREIR